MMSDNIRFALANVGGGYTWCLKPVLILMQLLGINLQYCEVHYSRYWCYCSRFVSFFFIITNITCNCLHIPFNILNSSGPVLNMSIDYAFQAIYSVLCQLAFALLVGSKWAKIWKLVKQLEFQFPLHLQLQELRKRCIAGVVYIILAVSCSFLI